MLKRLRQLIDIRDVHIYGGIILLSTGMAFISWQVGLMILGLGLLVVGLVFGWRNK